MESPDESELRSDDEMAVEPSGVSREVPRIQSTDLFRGAQELEIEHVGEIYRLRLTRNGKLILNK